MKIGLLVCDEVSAEYQSNFGDYPEIFQALFPHYEFEFYAVYKNEFPISVLDCEIYMATGSSHSVYEDVDWIHQTKAFIREIYARNLFFIGFCFGHQLMAEALGGKVEKSSDGWCVGIHQFSIFNQFRHLYFFLEAFAIRMIGIFALVFIGINKAIFQISDNNMPYRIGLDVVFLCKLI